MLLPGCDSDVVASLLLLLLLSGFLLRLSINLNKLTKHILQQLHWHAAKLGQPTLGSSREGGEGGMPDTSGMSLVPLFLSLLLYFSLSPL